MRAIGFSEYTDRKKLKELLTDVIMNSDHRAYTMNQEGILLGEFSKNHTSAKGAVESGVFGVAVCGEFDDNDKFIYEYYFLPTSFFSCSLFSFSTCISQSGCSFI